MRHNQMSSITVGSPAPSGKKKMEPEKWLEIFLLSLVFCLPQNHEIVVKRKITAKLLLSIYLYRGYRRSYLPTTESGPLLLSLKVYLTPLPLFILLLSTIPQLGLLALFQFPAIFRYKVQISQQLNIMGGHDGSVYKSPCCTSCKT